MFNITFCILSCAKNEKYKKRLNDFFEYGFKNINNNLKIKIVFLVEDEDKPAFVPDEYMWFNSPKMPLSCRFLKYLKETELDSEWIMQVDDDSSTDLDKTYELLSQFYNYQDSMMLMGGRNTDLEPKQQNILKSMDIKNFFFGSSNISKFDTHPYFVHAWEPTILSNKGLQAIKEWHRLEEYFNLCVKYHPTFGDQTPYVAARLAKVPIVECSFMSPFNKTKDYSALNPNGRYSHIHYITDKWDEYESFKIKMKNVKNGNYTAQVEENEKEDLWEFSGGKKGKERLYGVLNLNKDGTIGLYSNDNEFIWKKDEQGNIIFLNTSNHVTCVLHKVNENEYSGPFLRDPNVNHLLKKVL